MLEATTYTRIYGQQQLAWYKIFSYVFFVRKYFYNEIKANYDIFYSEAVVRWKKNNKKKISKKISKSTLPGFEPGIP